LNGGSPAKTTTAAFALAVWLACVADGIVRKFLTAAGGIGGFSASQFSVTEACADKASFTQSGNSLLLQIPGSAVEVGQVSRQPAASSQAVSHRGDLPPAALIEESAERLPWTCP
jgi:hypothetical protein